MTGSLNASLAQWLIADGLAPNAYVAAQGTRLERAGRVHVLQQDGVTWIGGRGAAAWCGYGDAAVNCALDHLVLAARTLDEGVDCARARQHRARRRRTAPADGHPQLVCFDRVGGVSARLLRDHRDRPRAAPAPGRALVRADDARLQRELSPTVRASVQVRAYTTSTPRWPLAHAGTDGDRVQPPARHAAGRNALASPCPTTARGHSPARCC